MSSHNDTRHIIDGATGGSNDDTTAYNDVTAAGSQLTFTSINGDQKSVSVSTGATAVTAYNSVSVSGNDIVFGKTDGSAADTQALGGLTAITDLQTVTTGHTTDISTLNTTLSGHTTDIATNASDISTLNTTVSGHTTSIDDLEAREILKTVTQYPDLTDAQLNAGTGSLSNKFWDVSDYRNRNYEIEGSSKFYTAYPYEAFTSITTNTYWNCGTGTYTTANGSYFDYSGTQSLDGNSGEWLRVKMPDSVILNSFTIQGAYNNTTPEERPRSFKLFGANNGTSSSSYDLLGEYNDIVIDYASGTNFKVDSSLAAYGTAYNTYAIVVSKSEGTSFAIGYLRFFSVSKDVAQCIKSNDETFNDASITQSGGTYYLNLERSDGANDVQLTLPTGGTAAGFNPAAIEDVTYSDSQGTTFNKPFIETTTQGNTTTQVELFDGFVSAVKDGDNIKLTTEAGNETTVGPFSGSSSSASSSTQHPTSPMTSNSLPSPLVAAASTEYNLFTDKVFGSDNLGNLGEISGGNFTAPLDYWAFDPSDGNVIVAAIDGTVLKMIKITQTGVIASNVVNPRRYETSFPTIASAAELISTYNSYSYHWASGGPNFYPHTLFDLAVNNSPAYYAFDEDATTQWISHSNRYDTVTGDALQTRFSGTPPSAIALGGYWHTGGGFAVPRYYAKNTSDETTTFVRYVLTDPNGQVGPNYGIAFYVDTNNDLILDAEWSVGGTATPFNLKVNGGAAVTSSVVQAGDSIELLGTGTSVEATLTVPSELSVVVESKLASTTDVGEYITLDVGQAVEATTLTLKSVAEYKEPTINLTDANQGGYVVSESSFNPNYPHAHELFNSLTTPSTDVWTSGINTYDVSTGNHAASANLGTDFPSGGTTVDGEYVAITLPDKRKLLGYKLTKEDGSTDDGSPKEFKLYARENSTSAWVLLNSETLTTAIGEYVSGDVNTGGTRFPSTGDLTPTTAYQTYALVVEKIFTSGSNYAVKLAEFQLFCQPSEIDEFKLYGSPDNSSWTEIHHQNTSANITSSATEFTITNPGSYQHYGLVVTKNTGYHNVSLGEMKLGVSESVNMSEYYKLADWKTLIAGCADFAAFKTAVAAL